MLRPRWAVTVTVLSCRLDSLRRSESAPIEALTVTLYESGS